MSLTLRYQTSYLEASDVNYNFLKWLIEKELFGPKCCCYSIFEICEIIFCLLLGCLELTVSCPRNRVSPSGWESGIPPTTQKIGSSPISLSCCFALKMLILWFCGYPNGKPCWEYIWRARRKAIKWGDDITFSDKIGNFVEKINESILFCKKLFRYVNYFSYLLYYLYKKLKRCIQLKRFLQNEIFIFPDLILMTNYLLKPW